MAAGFTLVELMVVVVIIAIVTGVVITSQGAFNQTLVLTNTAYDIALTLRSAETFGLSTRAAGAAVNAGYGLHFQAGSSGSFTLFADTFPAPSCATPNCNSGDHVYTSGSDTFVQTYELGNHITIADFCALVNNNWTCAGNGGLTSLDITFERPNPNAFMSENGAYSASSPVTLSCITLTSPQGGSRFLTVGVSGQIIANALSCP